MLFANVTLGVRSLAGELWILFHVQLAPPKFEKAYATFWNFPSFFSNTKRIMIFRYIGFFFFWTENFSFEQRNSEYAVLQGSFLHWKKIES